jgi:hypothetical protein
MHWSLVGWLLDVSDLGTGQPDVLLGSDKPIVTDNVLELFLPEWNIRQCTVKVH